MDIYRDLSSADVRSRVEAEQKYGPLTMENIDPWTDFQRSLMQQYRQEVCAKYGISMDELLAVLSEGASKNWPTPD